MEWQEVSRFRVSLNAAQQGKGIPILEDVPVAGALFRPRRTAAATMQENFILVECMVYPTSMTLVGKGSLALESTESPSNTPNSSPPLGVAAKKSAQDETTDWVLKTLRRRAQARVADAGDATPERPAADRPLATAPR